MIIQELIPLYEEYLTHERQLAKQTVSAYLYDLRGLASFTSQEVAQIELEVLRAYMRHLSKEGFSTNTVRRKMHGFSTFWEWLKMQGYVTILATEGLRIPRQKKPIPKWLTEEELKRFALTPAQRQNVRLSQRDSLAWKTLAWLGLRRSELLHLRSEDVRLADKLVIIRDTKNREDRALPLSEEMHAAFTTWLGSFTQHDFVFHQTPYCKWGVQPFWQAFQQQLAVCDLAGRGITPHTIRHSFGTLLVQKGVDVSLVSKLMGHKDIKNTMIYVHASPETLRQALKLHVLANS